MEIIKDMQENDSPAETQKRISDILMQVFTLKGVHTTKNEVDVCIYDRYVDLYLFVGVLAQRMAAGDIELIEKGDISKQKDFFYRLLDTIPEFLSEKSD